MTEDEAKTKWCPFVRFADGYSEERVGNYNRYDPSHNEEGQDPQGLDAAPCIASDCMAWRWHPGDQRFGADGPVGEGWVRDKGWLDYDRSTHLWRRAPTSGFCGLAGQT